jgi:antitoxin component YwqK of YwqJK toxin-antitoxin module
MKYATVLLLLLSMNGFAQCKEYIIGVKGDTLNCVDMKGRKQGRWVIKVDDLRGERGYEEEGTFKNSKKEGTWRRFSLEGDLIAVENYRWGNKDGKNIYLSPMGEPLREESWKAVNPDNPYDTVAVYDVNDPTKIVGHEVVKLEGFSLKHGTWKYYDPMQGTIEKTETWYLDKPAKKTGTGDDDLAPIAITDNPDSEKEATEKKSTTKPKEVLEYEKKNSGKKKIHVRTGSTGG